MREVAVLGSVGPGLNEHWDKSLRELAGMSILSAFTTPGSPASRASTPGHEVRVREPPAAPRRLPGRFVVGLRLAEGLRVESACSSGAPPFAQPF
jgi:acetyl-CoA C-acetyltransferase